MSVAACAELVERGDPDRFRSVLAAPAGARPDLMTLYAFNVEVTRAPWVTQEPVIAEMRIQWWIDTLDEIAAGQTPRAHEVAAPLAGTIRAHGLDTALLAAIAEARRADIDGTPPEDAAALSAYIDATGGNLMWAAAQVLGADAMAEPVVRDFAWGAALAAYLRAIPELEARGHRPLPDGRPEAVARLAAEGLSRLSRARAQRGRVAPGASAALLAGWRADATLRAAARRPDLVKAGSLPESEFRKRGALAFRALTGRW